MLYLIVFIILYNHTTIVSFMLMNLILYVNFICNDSENAKKLTDEENYFEDRCFKYISGHLKEK